MGLVKIRRAAQITLPAEVRQKLKIKEGDYLDAKVIGGAVVLKPVATLDREAAWAKLMEIVEQPKWRAQGRSERGRGDGDGDRGHPRHAP
jgi:AbrB family looped-hinge helix DNA binding protein